MLQVNLQCHITKIELYLFLFYFALTRYNTRHVALKVAYLGWDYHGFAVQEDNEKTIEAALFEALIKTKLVDSR